MRPAMANGRCNLHGGGALAGVAHQNFRSGRYAQDLPVRLRERYGRSLVDPNQLSLADDLAVKDARIGDLLSKLPSDGEMERGWQAFQSQFAAAKLARLRANDESQTEEQRAATQAHFWQSWAEIERLYGEVQQIIWDEAPFVFLWYQKQALGVSKAVRGFEVRPDETMLFHNITIQR